MLVDDIKAKIEEQTAPIYANVKLWCCEARSFLDQI